MIGIEHATILTSSQTIEDGTVLIDAGRIIAVGSDVTLPPTAHVIDATGQWLTPGLIDLQLNGGFGEDFTQDPTTIWSVAEKLPRYGVTAFLPTIITSPLATVTAAQHTLANRPSHFQGAEPLGLHLEGPFLNPAKKGAHNVHHIRACEEEGYASLDRVRLVTLAPEMPSALPFVRALCKAGVVVSAGHSMATFAEATTAFEAGIRYGTHLFNAMPPLHHREPGLAGALLADDRPIIGLIPDGVHVHPALLKAVWQTAPGRINVVTDSMAAMGMPPGVYQLGDYEVTVDETRAQLPSGTLAGSIVTLDAAVENFRRYTGCSYNDAVATATSVPAELLGLSRGRIASGCVADCVLFSAEWQVQTTLIQGKIAYQRS